MSNHDSVREAVSAAYARAVASPGGGCCGTAPVPKGVAARLAGYGAEELSVLPAEAVVNSFGCGNPLAFADVRPGEVVVDLGSGSGIDILIAARRVGPSGRVIGVDMTGEMVERARRNIAAAGLTNVEVRKGLIEELPVASASVDWVISNCVINLSPEKERVFAEIARVLRPGGRLVVSDIVADGLPEWVRSDPALYCSCLAGAISEAEYVAGLERAGLAAVEVRDRFAYDASQLKGLVRSEGQACAGPTSAELSSPRVNSAISDVADLLAGKVWSARFHARRPTD